MIDYPSSRRLQADLQNSEPSRLSLIKKVAYLFWQELGQLVHRCRERVHVWCTELKKIELSLQRRKFCFYARSKLSKLTIFSEDRKSFMKIWHNWRWPLFADADLTTDRPILLSADPPILNKLSFSLTTGTH